MGLFGWSLPPGCSNRDIDEQAGVYDVCEVCGHGIDDCICPECPTCSEFGDPKCYDSVPDGHGLTRNAEQAAGFAKLEAAAKAQAEADKAEGEYWNDPQRKVEEEEFAQLMRDERTQ